MFQGERKREGQLTPDGNMFSPFLLRFSSSLPSLPLYACKSYATMRWICIIELKNEGEEFGGKFRVEMKDKEVLCQKAVPNPVLNF